MSQLRAFMDAIAKVESGGESDPYRATGPAYHERYGRAQGKYQIMSKIWPDWARQAGYAGASPWDPRAQEAVTAYKMQEYFNRYRRWDLVAVAWFAGVGAANKAQQQAGGGNGGTSLETVRSVMNGIPGLRITSTYRDPEKNASVGGSKTSHHMNRDNPAVDIAGPKSSLDELHRRLRNLGLDAELLWQVPGHHDHVHFALRGSGGGVSSLGNLGDGFNSVPEYVRKVLANFEEGGATSVYGDAPGVGNEGLPIEWAQDDTSGMAQSAINALWQAINEDPGNPDNQRMMEAVMSNFTGVDPIVEMSEVSNRAGLSLDTDDRREPEPEPERRMPTPSTTPSVGGGGSTTTRSAI